VIRLVFVGGTHHISSMCQEEPQSTHVAINGGIMQWPLVIHAFCICIGPVC